MAGRFASPVSDEQESLLRQGFRGAKLDIRVKSLVPLFYTSKFLATKLIKEQTGHRSLEALHYTPQYSLQLLLELTIVDFCWLYNYTDNTDIRIIILIILIIILIY